MTHARGERGFAMLFVFLMAAIIAISLYMEIPRVSFESQRNKEALLIERGEQYQRAIKVFVRANKRYPASIEELESFNNHRYLRKRYIDPMTGKSEWRIVHIGPGGIFTDSLIHKPKTDKDKDKDQQQSTQNFIGDPSLGTNPGGPPQPSAVPRRRDNELATLCGGTAPGQPVPGQPAVPNQSAVPSPPGVPGVPGVPNQPGMPAFQVPGQVNPATGLPTVPPGGAGVPGATNPCPAGPLPGQPGYVAGTYPGQTIPGQPATSQPIYVGAQPGMQPGMPGSTPTASPYPTQPGAVPTATTPFGQPGTAPLTPGTGPTPPASAQQLIQNLLTQPRPGGMPGQPIASSPGGQTIGGGIAGIASNADEEGIKVYNDRTNYKEWEFLYDYTKDAGVVGQTGANGTPANQLNQPSNAQQNTGSSSPFSGGPGGSTFGQPPSPLVQPPSTFGAPPQPPPPPQPQTPPPQ